LAAGLAATSIRERLENNSASAFAGDAGLLLHYPAKDAALRVGLAARHLGSGFSYYQNRAPLPRTYAAGVSVSTRRIWGDPATLSVEVRKALDQGVSFSLGGEYWVNSLLALRGGYVTQDDLGPGVRAGIGLKIKIVEFDYGMSLMGGFGVAHRVGLTVRIGAPVQRTPTLSPEIRLASKAAKRARYLMGEKRHLDAMLEINRALELDPTSPEALGLLDQVQKMLKELERLQTP
jgi:hypothetical protein